MSRYTPHRPKDAKPGRKSGPSPKKKKPKKPADFKCAECEKAFRTEEALAIHARDAHGTAIDPAAMSAVAPNMVRCPECGMPVLKRNLNQHMHFVHELAG